jgi:hemerythrin
MAFITWKKTFEIGFELIDEQHKIFVNLLNELHEAQSKGTSQHVIKESLVKNLLQNLLIILTTILTPKKLCFGNIIIHK